MKDIKKGWVVVGRCSICKEIIVKSKPMFEEEAKGKIGTAIRLALINMPVCEKCGNQPPYKDVNHHYEIKIEKIIEELKDKFV